MVPRPPPRFYLAAVQNSCEIKSVQRPGDEATAKVGMLLLAMMLSVIRYTVCAAD